MWKRRRKRDGPREREGERHDLPSDGMGGCGVRVDSEGTFMDESGEVRKLKFGVYKVWASLDGRE